MKKLLKFLALLWWAFFTGICVVLLRGYLAAPPRPAIAGGIVIAQILYLWWQPSHHRYKEGDTSDRVIFRLLVVTALQGVILALAPWNSFWPAVVLAGISILMNYALGKGVLGVLKALFNQSLTKSAVVRDAGAVVEGTKLLVWFHVAFFFGEVVLSILWLAKS